MARSKPHAYDAGTPPWQNGCWIHKRLIPYRRMDPRCHVISLPSSRRDKPYIIWTGQSCPSHDQNHTTATRALFIYSNTPTAASAVSRERENYHLHCRNLNTPRPGNPLFLRKEPCNISTEEAMHLPPRNLPCQKLAMSPMENTQFYICVCIMKPSLTTPMCYILKQHGLRDPVSLR